MDCSYTSYSFPLYTTLGFILYSSDLCMVELWIDYGLGQGRHGPGLWDQAPRPPQACQALQHHVCKEELVEEGRSRSRRGAGAGRVGRNSLGEVGRGDRTLESRRSG